MGFVPQVIVLIDAANRRRGVLSPRSGCRKGLRPPWLAFSCLPHYASWDSRDPLCRLFHTSIPTLHHKWKLLLLCVPLSWLLMGPTRGAHSHLYCLHYVLNPWRHPSAETQTFWVFQSERRSLNYHCLWMMSYSLWPKLGSPYPTCMLSLTQIGSSQVIK